MSSSDLSSNIVELASDEIEQVNKQQKMKASSKGFSREDQDPDIRHIPTGYPCIHTINITNNGRVLYESGIEKFKRIFYTIFTAVLVVFVSSMDSILWTKISKSLAKVALIVSEAIYPLVFTVFILIFALIKELVGFFIYQRYKKISKTNSAFNSSSPLPPSIIPEKKSCYTVFFSHGCRTLFSVEYLKIFVVMALCDATGSLMAVYPIIKLDPILAMLIKQLNLFIIAIISKLYLGSEYQITHYIGCLTIFMSVGVHIVANYSSKDGVNLVIQNVDIFWCLLLLASLVPIAFGIVFKEKHLKNKNMDVLWTNVGVSLIQTFFSIPLSLAVLVPVPDDPILSNLNSTISIFPLYSNTSSPSSLVNNGDGVVYLGTFLDYISFGFQCLFFDFQQASSPTNFFTNNIDSILGNTNSTDIGTLNINQGEWSNISTTNYYYPYMANPLNLTGIVNTENVICKGTGFAYSVFIIFNVFYNIAITQLLKLTTSNITAIVHIFVLVSSNFLFSIKSLAGPGYHHITLWDFLSLSITTIGMVTFWLKPETIPYSTSNPVKKKPRLLKSCLRNLTGVKEFLYKAYFSCLQLCFFQKKFNHIEEEELTHMSKIDNQATT
jgi:hypothetical protein